MLPCAPSCHWMMAHLVEEYLKAGVKVVYVGSEEALSHHVATHKKMGLSLSQHATKGKFCYVDLFTQPDNSYDYDQLPLCEKTPPGYSDVAFKKNAYRQLSSEDVEALFELIKRWSEPSDEDSEYDSEGEKLPTCSSSVIIIDSANFIIDSMMDPCPLSWLRFFNSLEDVRLANGATTVVGVNRDLFLDPRSEEFYDHVVKESADLVFSIG